MRKLILPFAALAMVATTACSEKLDLNQELIGDEVTVTISTSALTSGGLATRADEVTTKEPADMGLKVYLESYYNTGTETEPVYELYADYGSNYDGDFTIRLVTGKDFMLVAWADYEKGLYDTESLVNIKVNDVTQPINDETADAFFGTYSVENITATSSYDMVLTRPFARINISTNDMDYVEDMLSPDSFDWVYTGSTYKSFNALTGEAGDYTEFSANENVYLELFNEKTGILAFDYLLAPAVGDGDISGVADFEFTFQKTGEGATTLNTVTLANIPYKRNYQTNISGNLLTDQANVDITINDEWLSPDIEKESYAIGDWYTVDGVTGKVFMTDEDGMYVLAPTHNLYCDFDAAVAMQSGSWRMPTNVEARALFAAILGYSGTADWGDETNAPFDWNTTEAKAFRTAFNEGLEDAISGQYIWTSDPYTGEEESYMLDGVEITLNSTTAAWAVSMSNGSSTYDSKYENLEYVYGRMIAYVPFEWPGQVTYNNGVTVGDLSAETVIVNAGVINGFVFQSSTALVNLDINEGVTYIGQQAFYNCPNLTGELTIPSGAELSYNGLSFGNTGITSLVYNATYAVSTGAFQYCTDLKTVTFTDRVVNTKAWAFYGCTSLTDVYFTSVYAPAFDAQTFTNNSNGSGATQTITFHVPAGCTAAYETAIAAMLAGGYTDIVVTEN